MAWSGNSGGYIDTVLSLGPNLAGRAVTHRLRRGADGAGAGAGAESFERWLQFVFRHCEIAIDDGVFVATRESRPSVYAHVFVDLYAMHIRWPSNCELHHSVLRFTLHREDLVQRPGGNGTFLRE